MVRNGGTSGRRENETHKLYTPTEYCGFLIFILGQGYALEDLQRVYDGNTSVELSARHVVIEILHKMNTPGCCEIVTARTSVYHLMASSGMPWALICLISSDLMLGNTLSNLCLAMAGGCRGEKGDKVG